MTAVIETDVADPAAPPPRRRRRRWIVASVVVVVVLALIGTGIGVLVYAHTYQPFRNELTSGPARERHQHLVAIGDGIEQTYWAVTGKPGTHATVDYFVRNTGSHAATLLGLPAQRSDYPPYITSVRWSNNSDNPGNGAALGLARDAHDFPVTVPAHGFVFIQVTVSRARCPRGGFAAIDDVPLRWSAMHVTHTWDMRLTTTDSDANPILVCAPRTALRRRER